MPDRIAEPRRRPRAARTMGSIPQRPFGQVPRLYDPIRVISEDQVAAIHTAALKLLSQTGMRILDPRAKNLLRAAGATGAGDQLCLDPALVAELLTTVPKTFSLAARNSAKSLRFGGNDCVFASVGGPAYVMDLDRGRRDGTHAEMCDYLRLIQSLNVIHQEGGGPFEPLDLPPNTRHLDICLA